MEETRRKEEDLSEATAEVKNNLSCGRQEYKVVVERPRQLFIVGSRCLRVTLRSLTSLFMI